MRWIQDVAACHCGGALVAKILIRLLALNDALRNVVVVTTTSKDHSNISKMSDGIIFPEKRLDLIVN